MDSYKSLLNLGGSAGKKLLGIEVVFCRGFCRFFVFLVVVFCGEDVVICVADVVFWQSLFVAQKMRHCFCKILMGGRLGE
jgi:hypothetical protein